MTATVAERWRRLTRWLCRHAPVMRGRLDGLLREARRLYRLGGGEKLSAFAQGQVAWAA